MHKLRNKDFLERGNDPGLLIVPVIIPDKTFQDFLGDMGFNLINLGDQTLRFLRIKIPVILVGMDTEDELPGIGFGMELGGVDILSDAKHLDRTGIRGSQ